MMDTHRGFSLVELLVVIVIMGILGTTIMLSSGSAVSSARAVAIVNNLRSLKSAAMLLYLDSPDAELKLEYLKTYIDNSSAVTDSHYDVTKKDDRFFIGYKLDTEPNKAEVKNRLKSRAAAAGLLNAADGNMTSYTDADTVYVVAY